MEITVTVPYWSKGDIYVGIGDDPVYFKLEQVNQVIYQGNILLPLGEVYYYSQGSKESREVLVHRQANAGRALDDVTGWQNDSRTSVHADFQKSLYINACHNCGVSYTKGNFIEPIGRSMDDIKKHGGNWVSFMPYWFIRPDIFGNEIVPLHSDEFSSTSGWIHATIQDDDLKTLIGMAHDRDLKVYVCPALAPENWGDDNPRGKGDLEPSNPDLFFTNYKNFLTHYADLAKQTGVDMMCVGSENDTLTQPDLSQNSGIDKNARWRDVIQVVRQHYSGKLTYSVACADEGRCGPQLIQFWDALDVIGWEWYVPIASGEHESIESMRANAERIIQNNIQPLYDRYQKPVVITEMGWEAYPGACAHTYGAGSVKGSDRIEQASCYEAVFQALEDADFIQGVHVWGWLANLPGDNFPWIWTDSVNEVRFSITEQMIDKWFKYIAVP